MCKIVNVIVHFKYLVKALVVEGDGLKLQVVELKGWIASLGGGVLLDWLKSSGSLIVAIDKGDLTTEPGVILGSSSTDFIWVPWNKQFIKKKKKLNKL